MGRTQRMRDKERAKGKTKEQLIEELAVLRQEMATMEASPATQGQTAAEPQESDDLLRTLVENTLDVITILDSNGTLTYESPSIEHVLGYRPEELVGRRAVEFVHPDDVPKIVQALEQVTRNPGLAQSLEFRFRHKDGSWRVLDGIGKSVPDDAGAVSVVVSSRDVTQRKQVERRLSQALAFTQEIIETSPIGIATYDSSGQCVSANPAAARIIGATVDQVLQQNMYHIESWNKSGLVDTAKEALADGIARQQEIHLTTTFGREVWLGCRFVPFTSDEGLHLLLMVDDRTERKRAQQALQQAYDEMEKRVQERTAELAQANERLRDNEETMRSLINAITESALLMAPDGTILVVNETTARRLGRRVDDLLDGNIYDFIPPDVTASRRAQAERVIRTGQPVQFEDERQGRTILNSIYPVFGAEGQVNRLAVFGYDITKRKQAQKELAQHAQQLERFNRMAVGREVRMVELKRRVNELSEELGREPPYDVTFAEK